MVLPGDVLLDRLVLVLQPGAGPGLNHLHKNKVFVAVGWYVG